MGAMIGLAALAALFAWLMGFGSHRPTAAPEDDVETPIDVDELEQAELEMRDDRSARAIGEALAGEVTEDGEEEEDWGPGSPGHGGLPGIS